MFTAVFPAAGRGASVSTVVVLGGGTPSESGSAKLRLSGRGDEFGLGLGPGDEDRKLDCLSLGESKSDVWRILGRGDNDESGVSITCGGSICSGESIR